MNPETRQTLIGVTGMTFMMVAANSQGFNAAATVAYLAAVVIQVSPEVLGRGDSGILEDS